MKKTIVRILSLIMVLAMFCTLGLTQAFADLIPGAYEGYVSGNGVNFRKGPGTSYAVKGAYCYGTPVTILKTLENGWVKVSIFQVEGYMYGAYVSRGSHPVNAVPTKVSYDEQGETAYINHDDVNFRVAPGEGYVSLGKLKLGTEVTIVQYNANGWYGVLVNGYPGFVYGDYVTAGTYTPADDILTIVDDAELGSGYINTTGVVIRNAPSSGAAAVFSPIRDGLEVEVIAVYSNDWYGITFKDNKGVEKSGYVYGPYVTLGSYLDDVVYNQSESPYEGHCWTIKSAVPFGYYPSFDYPIQCNLPIGTELEISAEIVNAKGETWYAVTAGNGKLGFVYAPFVSEDEDDIPDQKASTKDFDEVDWDGIVNTDNSPMRAKPKKGSTVIAYLTKGQPVTVTREYENGYYQIVIDDISVGYIYKTYVE